MDAPLSCRLEFLSFLGSSMLRGLLLGVVYAVLLRAAAYWVSKTHVRFLRAYGLSVLLSVLGSVCDFVLLESDSTLAPVGISLVSLLFSPSRVAPRYLACFVLLLAIGSVLCARFITQSGGDPIGIWRGFLTALLFVTLSILLSDIVVIMLIAGSGP
jgi:hypothetical protein